MVLTDELRPFRRVTQKADKLSGGRKSLWFVVSQCGGMREICRVDGDINSLRYQEVIAAHYIQNQRRRKTSAGWSSFSYFSLDIRVPESKEGRGAPGLASQATTGTLLSRSGVRGRRRH